MKTNGFMAATCLWLSSFVGGFAEHTVFDWDSAIYDDARQSLVGQAILATNDGGNLTTDSGGSTSLPHNGTQYGRAMDGLRFKHCNGLAFRAMSIELAEYSIFVDSPSLIFTGIKSDGATVTTTFNLDDLCDGPGAAADFESFHFPETFDNLVELRGPATQAYSTDNLVCDTIVPPALPAKSAFAAAYSGSQVLHQRSNTSNHFIVGDGFSYPTGFANPTSARFLSGSNTTLFPASSCWHDDANGDLYYSVFDSGVRRFMRRNTSAAEVLLEFHELADAGFVDVVSVSKPRPYKGGCIFLGFNFSGADRYWILAKQADGSIVEMVGPSSQLPYSGGVSGPYNFPDNLCSFGNSYAFDTSLAGTSSKDRVYVSFHDRAMQLLATEDDAMDPSTPELGNLISVDEMEFNAAGELVVIATTSTGQFYFTYSADDGLVSSVERQILINPVNAGHVASGTLYIGPDQTQFLLASYPSTALYRKLGDQWYYVIAIGDIIDGKVITYLRYLARPASGPSRVILDVRFDGGVSTSYNIELELLPPVELAPRVLHAELASSGHLFIGIGGLTSGRNYVLKESSNLANWSNVGTVDVTTVQNIVIEPPPAKRRFFVVEEQP